MRPDTRVTLGVIVGNREFFPDHLVTEARARHRALFDREGIEAVILDEHATHLGGVQTYADARPAPTCSASTSERSTASSSACRTSATRRPWPTRCGCRMQVPVLIQAYPDTLDQLSPATRRDAFCGKISVCNNLKQRGIPSA
jgi:L-fucose isomerase-like protein